jgi:hypothetical protein
MKKTIFKFATIIIALTLVSEIFAGAFIPQNGLTAKSENGSVVIEWKTLTEDNLDYFAVERKTANMTDFQRIAGVQIWPNSNHYYRYEDKSAYKTTDNAYTYRIAIVDKDGSVSHSSEIFVIHNNVSGVKRTWGSIKALFR